MYFVNFIAVVGVLLCALSSVHGFRAMPSVGMRYRSSLCMKIGKALIGGNWKCNGTLGSVKQMAEVLNKAGEFSANSEVVIAAPSLHLQNLKSIIRPDISVSAEDVSFKKGYGAFTGEITAEMLVDSGFKWTLTGHSERRVGFGIPGETSQVVAVKTKNAIDAGLSVIVCIGEQLADRQSGNTMKVCAEQLAAVQAVLTEADWKKVVLAYEPVWAIGTGVTATPQQAQDTHAEIRAWLAKHISDAVAKETRIIYGGSATAANCNELYAQPDINGFLVGGASLKPEFVDIINCTK
jgi:triosephosphate isomerase